MSRIVFVHVTSAIGVFAAFAIEGATLLQIRRSAASAQLRAALAGFRLVPCVALPSLLVTLLSGSVPDDDGLGLAHGVDRSGVPQSEGGSWLACLTSEIT